MLLVLASAPLVAVPEYPTMGPDIFDAGAKAETLIKDATVQAARENKRVLLLFGANWCPWCRRLHQALSSDPRVSERLRQHFILVYLDANTRNDRKRNAAVIERYGNPLQYGLPVFVVLDAKGERLATQETASLSDPTGKGTVEKILAFLGRW